MDRVTGGLTLEHAVDSPELKSIHHDRFYERVKQLNLQPWVSDAQLTRTVSFAIRRASLVLGVQCRLHAVRERLVSCSSRCAGSHAPARAAHTKWSHHAVCDGFLETVLLAHEWLTSRWCSVIKIACVA